MDTDGGGENKLKGESMRRKKGREIEQQSSRIHYQTNIHLHTLLGRQERRQESFGYEGGGDDSVREGGAQDPN